MNPGYPICRQCGRHYKKKTGEVLGNYVSSQKEKTDGLCFECQEENQKKLWEMNQK